MLNIFEFIAETRTELGKGATRRMRHAEKVPAVVYGAGQEAQSITLEHNPVKLALENDAVYAKILTLKIDGKPQKVVIKEVQRHVYKPKIHHIDFLRINEKEKLSMTAAIHFLNEEEAPGVKAGGVVSKVITELEIKCLPADLPEFIELDMVALEIDTTLHLSDIKLPAGVELATPVEDEEHNLPIVSIHTPKAEKVEEEAAEGEAAEGEGDKADAKAEDKPKDGDKKEG